MERVDDVFETTIPVAGTFAVVVLVLLMVSQQRTAGYQIPAHTVFVGVLLLYQVGEITYAVLMLGIESRILGVYDYELYRLSPIDSIAIQRSIRGSNRIAMLVGLVATVVIIGFIFLLPGQSSLTGQITLMLLVMAYLATGFGALLPRMAMKQIIRAEKEREMAPLHLIRTIKSNANGLMI